ncbi:MAG: hypothetical protein JW751_19725 [Polyangiaceae bacterium]|nr:hypothetical protein [Polyangiaceae bacterium]
MLGLTHLPEAAAAGPTLSGRWQASAMQGAWSVGDWGEACGPRPTGGGDSAGPAVISQRGGELVIQGPNRTYTTNQCWELFPGMTVVSHAGGQRGWRTECRTAAGDPRQATITTTIVASDDYINFQEIGQYQFVVNRQNCTASTRRSRSFRLLRREGEPLPSASSPPVPAVESAPAAPVLPPPEPSPPAPVEPPRSACASLGEPARLEVRPAKKLLRPGESFVFRAVVLDQAGCALPLVPTWTLVNAPKTVSVTRSGRVEVTNSAEEGEVALDATASGRSARVTIAIVSALRYDALLASDEFDSSGASRDAAIAVIASGSIGAGPGASDESGAQRRWVFLSILGLLALLSGGVGIALLFKPRRPAPGEPAPTGPGVGSRCPTCGREHPPGAMFCKDAEDSAPLVLSTTAEHQPPGAICPVCAGETDPGEGTCAEHQGLVGVGTAAPPREIRKICPICGIQYGSDAEFCGSDGAQLVPLN